MPIIDREAKTAETWEVRNFLPGRLGLNTDSVVHIDDGEISSGSNVVYRNGHVEIDSGYKKSGVDPHDSSHQVLYGNPRLPFQHTTSSGSLIVLLITDETVYKLAGDRWELVGRDLTTTVAAPALTGGETSVTVVSTAGMAVGDIIAILDDSADQQFRKISALPGGNVITLDVALPTPFVAAIGNSVVVGPRLAGTSDNEVVAVDVPFMGTDGWMVFTNGVDRIQKYDGANVTEITQINTDISVTACRTLGLYSNSLILCNVIRGGSAKTTEVWWSDAGDLEEWVTGTSGDDVLADSSDPIVAIEQLGGVNIIYKERSIVRQEFVGTLLLHYRFRTTITGVPASAAGVGAVSANAVVNLDSYHMVFATDGIYRYRGGFTIERMSDKVFQGFFSANGEIDKEKANRFFTAYMDEYDEVHFFYLTTNAIDYCDRSLIFQVKNQAWFKRTWLGREFAGAGVHTVSDSETYNDLTGEMGAQTWTALSRTISGEIPNVLLADAKSGERKIYEYDYLSQDDAGVAIAWNFSTREVWFDNEILTDRFELLGTGVAFTLRAGNEDDIIDTFTIPFEALRKRHPAFQQRTSRNLKFLFSGASSSFVLEGVYVRFRQAARWKL